MSQALSIDPALATLDLDEEIRRLKRERNAVLLAHFYQDSEIQDLADFIGDSLELARRAKETTADVIVFAGVHFMAETAKILNPERTVLVPDMAAGCSLADGCPADRFRAWQSRYPDSITLSYINCSAEVKALMSSVSSNCGAPCLRRNATSSATSFSDT
jgi:quinolinate synthase